MSNLPQITYRPYNLASDALSVRQLLVYGKLSPGLHQSFDREGIVAVTPAGHIVGVIVYELGPKPPGKQLHVVQCHGVAVSPPWRSKGIGRTLQAKLARLHPDRKIVLTPVLPEEGETRDLRDYYRTLGYKSDTDNAYHMSRKP